MIFKSFFKKTNYVLFLLIIFIFGLPSFSSAYALPNIPVNEIKIRNINNNTIKGSFSFTNKESHYIGDLNYEIVLLKGTSLSNSNPIDVIVSENRFSISPDETITSSFEFNYPKDIVSGDYLLMIQILSSNGNNLGWKYEKIKLSGENKLLTIIDEYSRVITENNRSFALTGANTNVGSEVIASLRLQNPGEEITVEPRIRIFKRQSNMTVLKEYRDSPITFLKEETKDIKLTMPKFDNPESYLAEIKFYQGNEQLSDIQYFRWVIRGINGKILYLKTDKDYYKNGDVMQLTIDLSGPADMSETKNNKLSIFIYDKQNNLITEISELILLNSDITSKTFSIPINKEIISPTIKAELSNENNIIDNALINLSHFTPSKEAKNASKNIILIIVFYLVITIVIVSLIIIFYKKGYFRFPFSIKRK